MIRTPDQRVRVFVSSTLQELADERAAVRAAITQLRLTPVMFELGARPHPPADLYRSYLEQSDVFVGVYWQSYGWVAPGAAVSGIEDEYELAGDRPRLIYVKEPATEREARLESLLERVRIDGRSSYKLFDAAGSLAGLLSDDLALLVSERFHAPGDEARMAAGTLTFLFADMERSTQLLEELGDQYSEILRIYHGLLGAAATRQGGHVESRAGDGAFCVFEDAVGAVEAAVELQRSLSERRLPGGVDVRARIGAHTGVARRLPEGYVGIDVHRAARVGEAAQGGQIVVSETTASLIAGHAQHRGWALHTLGDFDLRGLSRAERLSQVVVPGVTDSTQPVRARRVGASRVPTPMTSLVGRARELVDLERLLTQPNRRLVTLTGSGGIGKTRLAMEVAHTAAGHFSAGVGWVGLDSVSDPQAVPNAIATALGLLDSGRQSVLDIVAEYLADKDMLLVLDNFEQVLPAAPLVTDLLDRAPGLTVLVTSRSPLRVRAEYEIPVAVLDYPQKGTFGVEMSYPAVELFIERARAANPKLVVDSDQLESIAALTARLDGLPLAIELAAARTRYLDPAALASRMTSLLDMLSRGAQDMPARHRTMRETIGWSERLLGDTTRRLFRRLAVFLSNPTLDAVVAVTNWDGSVDGDPLTELETIADLGLIGLESAPGERGPEVSMLHVVREYALDELASHDELEATRRAHAVHFLQICEEAAPYLWTPQRGPWLVHLERSQSDIAAAFATMAEGVDLAGAWRLAAAVGPYIFLRGPYGQALRLLAEAGISADADIPDGVSELTAGVALQSAGAATFLTGDFAAALPPLHRSVELLTAAAAGKELARTCAYLGLAGISTGDPSAMVELAAARVSGEELGDLASFAIASAFSGEVSMAIGDFDGARELLRLSEERCRAVGDRWLLGLTLVVSGSLAIVADDIERAIPITEEAYELLAAEQPGVSGWPLIGLAYCHWLRDEFDVARKYFEQSVDVGRRVGDKTIVLSGLIGLGVVSGARGEVELAARLIGAADAIRLALGYRLWSATAQMYEKAQGLLASAVDATVVEKERVAGSRMTYQEALALAAG